MKLMVASDIHGSAYYCELLTREFRRQNAEKLLLLGDILYHGPRNDLPRDYSPKQTAELLDKLCGSVFCVRGNCDADVDQLLLRFPILAEYCLLFADGITLYAVHGHKLSDSELPPLNRGDAVLFGHTHIPECRTVNGITLLNPGSVSIPKNGTPHSYILLNEGTAEWYDLEDGCRPPFMTAELA